MDKNNTFYVDAHEILGVLDKSVEQGMSLAPLLTDLGLSPQLLDDPRAKIDMEDCWRIITAHQNIIQEETHLMSTRPLKRGTTRFVFSNLTHCENLLDGLELLADTYNVLHGGNYNFVKKRGDAISFIVDDKDFHYSRKANSFVIEFALIRIHCALTCLVGREIKPLRICTKRKGIAHDKHHLNIFDCAVNFDHPHYELVYASDRGTLPFNKIDDIGLSSHLLADYLSIVRQRPKVLLEDVLVRKVIDKIMQGFQGQEEVALAIGMSVPTLRRKLKQQEVSFRELLDKVNSELAVNDLLDQVAPADVAEKLGYCDVRSFKRAFKRWFGVSPAAFLKKGSLQ